MTGELFEIVEEKKIAVVSDYCIWYDRLISEADIDERSWNKWLDHHLVLLDSYPGERFIVKIKKNFFNRNAQTALQRLHAQKRKVSGLVKHYRLEKLRGKTFDRGGEMKKTVEIIVMLTVLLIGSCLYENVPSPSGTLSVTECHDGNYKIMEKVYTVNSLMKMIRTHKVKRICLTADKADPGIDNTAHLIRFCRENGI